MTDAADGGVADRGGGRGSYRVIDINAGQILQWAHNTRHRAPSRQPEMSEREHGVERCQTKTETPAPAGVAAPHRRRAQVEQPSRARVRTAIKVNGVAKIAGAARPARRHQRRPNSAVGTLSSWPCCVPAATRRAIACMSFTSRQVGPERAPPRRKIGAST